MGTWIEITGVTASYPPEKVVPLVGTWIEIGGSVTLAITAPLSFPSWERGLKSLPHTPSLFVSIVVPLVGTWIEIRGKCA